MARVKHIPRPGKRTRRSNSSNGKFQFLKPSFSQFHIFFFCIYSFQNYFSANESEEKKKRRNRPGTVALREIRKFQKAVNLLIPCAPFVRCVSFFTPNSYISSKLKLDLCF